MGSANTVSQMGPRFAPIIQVQNARTHHDPFDFTNTDSSAYAFHPLIFSDGPDKLFSITKKYPIGWWELNLSAGGDLYTYDSLPSVPGVQLIGFQENPSWDADNITNHDLNTR